MKKDGEKIVCIIPARYDSSRFPGKVLYKFDGQSILERVYNRAKRIKILSDIYIATDSPKIAKASNQFGAKVIMTSKNCASGSDRAAEAAEKIDCSIIVNIQADEPFLPGEAVEAPLKLLKGNPALGVTTSATKIRKKEELYDPNIVKIVIDKNNDTLYSSRALIPFPNIYFSEERLPYQKKIAFYKHIGVYIFTKDFLAKFKKWPVSFLERIESLEQLRIIENGKKLRVALIKEDSPCVDTIDDIRRIQEKMSIKKN